MASASTNQAAIVGTNAPKRSNWDCIRSSLQDHARPHEIGSKRCRSDDDRAQCLGFRWFCQAPVDREGMATEGARLCCPSAEFPDRWIANRLREPDEQARARGGDFGRQLPSIERAFQTVDCLRG